MHLFGRMTSSTGTQCDLGQIQFNVINNCEAMCASAGNGNGYGTDDDPGYRENKLSNRNPIWRCGAKMLLAGTQCGGNFNVATEVWGSIADPHPTEEDIKYVSCDKCSEKATRWRSREVPIKTNKDWAEGLQTYRTQEEKTCGTCKGTSCSFLFELVLVQFVSQ